MPDRVGIAAHSIPKTVLKVNLYKSFFKKETGKTAAKYILLKSIETVRNLLALSEYSYAETAVLLAFSSRSHFIRIDLSQKNAKKSKNLLIFCNQCDIIYETVPHQ